jgi:hypothetical protein
LVEPRLAGFPADFTGVYFARLDLDEVEVRRGCTQRPVRPFWAACRRRHLTRRLATPPCLQGLGDALSIGTLPTFLLLREGREVHRLEGVPQTRPARALAQALRAHLLPADG